MQQQGAGPDCRFREFGSGVLGVDVRHHHTIFGKSIEVGSEVDTRIVGSEIVGTERIDDKNEDVWAYCGSGGQVFDQINISRGLSVTDVGMGTQNATKVSTNLRAAVA